MCAVIHCTLVKRMQKGEASFKKSTYAVLTQRLMVMGASAGPGVSLFVETPIAKQEISESWLLQRVHVTVFSTGLQVFCSWPPSSILFGFDIVVPC